MLRPPPRSALPLGFLFLKGGDMYLGFCLCLEKAEERIEAVLRFASRGVSKPAFHHGEFYAAAALECAQAVVLKYIR